MSYNNGSEMWDWRGQIYLDDNTGTEASHSVDQNVDQISYMFDHEITPVKACSLPRYACNNETKGRESELYRDHSSQVKRRRMLQFESEVMETPLCKDEEFLRSKETQDSLEADISQWVAGFMSSLPSSNECLDPGSSEGWITGCFDEAETHLCNGTSAPEHDQVNVVMNNLKTPQNVAFTGTKSYIRTPPKRTSTVVYPFAFIKPCGVLGDMTLNDINRWLHNIAPKPT